MMPCASPEEVRRLGPGATACVNRPLRLGDGQRRAQELGGPLESALPAGITLGVSTVMRRIESVLERLAGADGTVLIAGESGVSKEKVARRLHELGGHGAERAFVAVHCAAIPETLLEAELFGDEKGACTGAVKDKRGYFQQADGGPCSWMKSAICPRRCRSSCCARSRSAPSPASVQRRRFRSTSA